MSKVFRLHTGNNTITDWGISSNYDYHVIQQIEDPNNATCKREITSIPSPFARMDLVKNAFKIVSDKKENLKGSTIYHKLVSDTLDVGQIFFEIDKLRDKVEILVWDKEKHIAELTSSNQYEHQILGESLKLFLEQDSNAFNFNLLKRIYLLNYIGKEKPEVLNIIGATSPATLFFTTANNIEYVSRHITFGNDRPFDGDFLPLFLRNFDYQKFWYYLQKTIPMFAQKFPEVSDYLDKNYKFLDDSKKNQIDAISNDTKDQFDELTVNGEANYIEVIGHNLMKMKNRTTKIEANSDFVISPVCDINSPKPLVLPVDTFKKEKVYVDAHWDNNTKVNYFDKRPLSERTLPSDNSIYPYLTIGDFLEDTIVKLPRQINSLNFFNGNFNDDTSSFLLPIKKEYFDYFPASTLFGEHKDGRKIFEIEKTGPESVKVTLRVHIKNNDYITFEKGYYLGLEVNDNINKGTLIEKDVAFAIYPNIGVANDDNKQFYRVTLIDREGLESNNDYILQFFNDKSEIQYSNKNKRNRHPDNSIITDEKLDSVTYSIENNFNLIKVTSKKLSGYILPFIKTRSGTNQVTFSVDFGTTNTHIEYSINGAHPEPFSINNDVQINKLHKNYDALIDYIFDEDVIPESIGNKSRFHFPISTIISEQINTDWNLPVVPLVHTNIPFVYGKRQMSKYNKHITGLKWSSNQIDQNRTKHFIESLFIMMRNKVLLNNGDLSKTKIVWFYPASMTNIKYDSFKSKWEELYIKYFGANLSNVISISESAAPYRYHKNVDGASADVVTIDIGGGTTDVLIVENGNPILLTSFRFAANSIFGDGYSYNSSSNGFVKKYLPEIQRKLTANKQLDLLEILNSIEQKKDSSEIIAFIFSLSLNKDLTDKNIKIDLNEMLRDDDKFKYIFILFYTAIIYHVAKIMKQKNAKMPRHITFSGTGSKVLSIITPSNETLADYTKLIFEKIYHSQYSENGLTIIRSQNPKEVTCKGGALEPLNQDFKAIDNIKYTLLGIDDEKFADSSYIYDDILKNNVLDIKTQINYFIDFCFDINSEISFNKVFGANTSIIEKVKSECKKDIESYLKEGINKRKEEIINTGADNHIEESLFFFPLVGMLNSLSRNF